MGGLRPGLPLSTPAAAGASSRELELPAQHRSAQRREAAVAQLELVRREPIDPAEHLGEDRPIEAAVLLNGETAEVVEAVERLDGSEVDEVAGFGPAEEREQLVGGELLQREHGSDRARLRGQQPVVDAQVDLGLIVTAG